MKSPDIHIRVEPLLLDQLKQEAKAKGLSLSAYCQMILRERHNRTVERRER